MKLWLVEVEGFDEDLTVGGVFPTLTLAHLAADRIEGPRRTIRELEMSDRITLEIPACAFVAGMTAETPTQPASTSWRDTHVYF